MNNRLASRFVEDLSSTIGRATQNHMKKELMDICKCSKTTLEQIINDLNCQVDLAIKNHIKKGVLWKQ